MERVAVKVLFTGRVQGVGFRYRTEDTAQEFTVFGYVKNLPNGQVELIAEGSSDEVARFVHALEERMAGHIDEVSKESISSQGFERFFISR